MAAIPTILAHPVPKLLTSMPCRQRPGFPELSSTRERQSRKHTPASPSFQLYYLPTLPLFKPATLRYTHTPGKQIPPSYSKPILPNTPPNTASRITCSTWIFAVCLAAPEASSVALNLDLSVAFTSRATPFWSSWLTSLCCYRTTST